MAEQSRYGTRNAALTWRNEVPARLAAYPAQFSEWITLLPGREVLAVWEWPGAVIIGPPGETGRRAGRPSPGERADREHEGHDRDGGAGAMELPHLSSFPVR